MKIENKLGKIRLFIDGFNQTKLLNRFLKDKIAFFDVDKIDSSHMLIWVYKKDSTKVFDILQELCYNSRIVTIDWWKGLQQWGLKRIGALVGAIVFVTVLILSNNFVWRVNILGLETVPLNTVQNILQDKGIRPGVWASSIDRDDIKQQILQLDNVVDASIFVVGTTLNVTVFENFEIIPPDPEHNTSIYSNYDGIITRVVVTEGTATVKPGDIVVKGAELVSPYIYNTNGEILATVKPQARVYGTVSFSDSRFFTETQIEMVRTGNQKMFNDLNIFGWQLSRKFNPYSFFETQTNTSYLFGNSLLPIKVDNITYFELERQEKKVDINEHRDMLVQQMLRDLQLKAGSSNFKQQVDLRQVSGGYRVDLFVSVELLLS
ncbi:MAG: sporulation protein YqfD [Firmicutes bacterium]|nr:sporulation protein YqfD [Bacillota bacterium]